MALQVGYVPVDGSLTPTIATSASSSLSLTDVHIALLSSVGPMALVVLLIELYFVVGYLLFALQTMYARVFPQWAGLLLLSGVLLFSPQILLPPFVVDVGAALLGLGFLETGYFLLFT